VQPPLLSAGIAFNRNLRAFRMAAQVGQEAAGIAVGGPMALHLMRGQAPAAALANGSPEPGRTQLGVCLITCRARRSRCVAPVGPARRRRGVGAVDQ
jgi:gamma-glutamyltranspeptidase/glutathione hydrolase